MWWLSRYMFEPRSSKIWTLEFQFYHIFSNSRTSGVQTWFLNQVWFHIHTTHSPMLKLSDYKVLQQIKIRVYVNIELNNELKLIINYKVQSTYIFLPCFQKCFFMDSIPVSNLAKHFFHGLILVSVPASWCQLGSGLHEPDPEP
jgi:hypothetical protein